MLSFVLTFEMVDLSSDKDFQLPKKRNRFAIPSTFEQLKEASIKYRVLINCCGAGVNVCYINTSELVVI